MTATVVPIAAILPYIFATSCRPLTMRPSYG